MIDNLTKKEYEILELLANGLSGVDICNRLFVANSTYRTHAAHIFKKLNVKNVNGAICKYYKHKIQELKQLVKERLHVDNI